MNIAIYKYPPLVLHGHKVIVYPPIPVESSSALGYLGHWDKKGLMHFEIFCGGSDKAKIIEKGQAAAPKDKQKSKSFLKKGTVLYQHNAVPAQVEISAKRTYGTDNAIALKFVKTDGDYDQIKILGDFETKKEVAETKDIKISGTEQTFWMKKGAAEKSKYSAFKGDEADYYTWQAIKGWSTKPLDEIIPDASKNMKTVPYDLYSKKTGKSVTFQKNKYGELILRQESCDKNQPYTAYVKDKDIEKYSKHEWKDFISIKESNPASIGTVAKEALVQSRAEEIKTVPALGSIATEDDHLSSFAKTILTKLESQTDKEAQNCLLAAYKELQKVYQCEDQRSKLMRLVCRHPTEWYYTPKKAQVLKLNDAQIKQVKALSWWDEASGVKDLPEPQNVWHFHPAGFLGNLMGGICRIDEYYFFEKYLVEFGSKSLTNSRKISLIKMFVDISEFLTDHTEYKCNKKKLAYMLATAKLETGHTFDPITEGGARSYFNKYDPILADTAKRKARAIKMENTKEGDGYKYKGRGFVQLTWKKNYRRSGEYLGLDLVNKPELALNHTNAIKIMIYGMETGLFTTRKLSDYISATKTDYYNARRIINGTDKASTIKGYAEKIEKCIRIF